MPLYSVLYPGNFWSRYTGLDAPPPEKKKYSKVSFFIKQIKNSFLFHEVFRKLDILQDYLWFKYSMAKEKRRDFIKKNMKQLPNPQCAFLSNMQQVTIQNYLDSGSQLFKTVVQNYRFNFETVIVKMDSYRNLIC